MGMALFLLGALTGAIAACGVLRLRRKNQDEPESQTAAPEEPETQTRQKALDAQWANLMAYDGTVQEDGEE